MLARTATVVRLVGALHRGPLLRDTARFDATGTGTDREDGGGRDRAVSSGRAVPGVRRCPGVPCGRNGTPPTDRPARPARIDPRTGNWSGPVAASAATVLGSSVRHPSDADARGALLPPPRRPAPRRGPFIDSTPLPRSSSRRHGRSTTVLGPCPDGGSAVQRRPLASEGAHPIGCGGVRRGGHDGDGS